MTFGLPCDSSGYDLRIEPCRQCGSRGCPNKHQCWKGSAPMTEQAVSVTDAEVEAGAKALHPEWFAEDACQCPQCAYDKDEARREARTVLEAALAARAPAPACDHQQKNGHGSVGPDGSFQFEWTCIKCGHRESSKSPAPAVGWSPEAAKVRDAFFEHKKDNPEHVALEDMTPLQKRMQSGGAGTAVGEDAELIASIRDEAQPLDKMRPLALTAAARIEAQARRIVAAEDHVVDLVARIADLEAVVEDAINTLEAMDLHVDNPLYARLRAAREGKDG